MSKNLWESDIPPAFEKAEETLNKFNIAVPAIEISRELERTLSWCNSDSLKAVLGISEKLERTIPSWNLNTMEAVLGMSRAVEHLMPKHTIFEQNYGTAMLKAMEQAIPRYNLDGITTALKGLSSVLGKQLTIDHQKMIESVLPQIKTTFDSWDRSTALDALVNNDWSWISEMNTDKEEPVSDSLEHIGDLTDEIRAEMVSDIDEVIQTPAQAASIWQANYVKWKERNPFWAELFMSVLSNIFTDMLKVLLGLCVSSVLAFANKDAKVYEEPTASSNIVYNVTMEQNFMVTGDTKYYYEVEIPDPATGETVIGYVYKGNVTVIEAESEPNGEGNESAIASRGSLVFNHEVVLSE